MLLNEITENIKEILHETNYGIQLEIIQHHPKIPHTHSFSMIDYDTNKVVSNVEMAMIGQKTNGHSTLVWYIKYIETTRALDYSGKGWATLLLLYAIITKKNETPDINYFTLDDASAMVDNEKHNIYDNIGFQYIYDDDRGLKRKLLVLDESDKISISTFETNAIQLTNKIRRRMGMSTISRLMNRDAGKKTKDKRQKQKANGKRQKTKYKKQKTKSKRQKKL